MHTDDFVLDYTANNTFAQVHQDPSKFIFIRGSVGSGKSSGCILHCFLNALEQAPMHDGVRRSKYGIIRATYPNLKSTTVESWKEWFGPLVDITYDMPIRGKVKIKHPDGVTYVEMDLVFIALDREDDIKKLQSLQLNGAHINEAAEVPRGVFQMIKSRINRYPKKFKVADQYRDPYRKYENKLSKVGSIKPFIILDYNSIPTNHWLYDMAEKIKPEKHSFYTQPPACIMCTKSQGIAKDAEGNWYKINPNADNVEHLDEDYYIDQIDGADPAWISVFVLNNYGTLRAGRPVYKAYDDRAHCTAEPIEVIKGIPIIIGIDTGLTPAAAFTQLSSTGRFVVFDEIVTEDCSIQEFADDHLWPKIRNHYRGFKYELVVDPENKRSQTDKKTATDILRKAGFVITKGKTNEELARHEAVNFFLRKKDGFLISDECTILRQGFIADYKYVQISATVEGVKWKDKPDKNIFSHVHDALQYAALEFAEGRIFRKNTAKKQTYTTPGDTTAGY